MHVSFIALLACNFTIFVELEVMHEGFIRRLILRLIKGAAASVWWGPSGRLYRLRVNTACTGKRDAFS